MQEYTTFRSVKTPELFDDTVTIFTRDSSVPDNPIIGQIIDKYGAVTIGGWSEDGVFDETDPDRNLMIKPVRHQGFINIFKADDGRNFRAGRLMTTEDECDSQPSVGNRVAIATVTWII
jgi:hypothetical protein